MPKKLRRTTKTLEHSQKHHVGFHKTRTLTKTPRRFTENMRTWTKKLCEDEQNIRPSPKTILRLRILQELHGRHYNGIALDQGMEYCNKFLQE